MAKNPHSPNYDPADDPKVVTASEGLKKGKIPNELPPETQTITFHQRFERNATLLLIASLGVVSIGGIVEIAPLFWLENTIEEVEGMRPYSPLELAGREIYVREGCYTCHSQMIRPMRDETERYGHYSLAAESMYDHPFQWGSKRTGPDLARVGGRYSDEWHVDHLMDPQSVVPESVMPKYAFLMDAKLEPEDVTDLVATHRTHDSQVWQDDGVEIYIDTDLDQRSYWGILANCIGTILDSKQSVVESRMSSDISWNGDFQLATRIEPTYWSIEVALPSPRSTRPAPSRAMSGALT